MCGKGCETADQVSFPLQSCRLHDNRVANRANHATLLCSFLFRTPKEREPQPAESYKPTKEEEERGVFFYCYGKKPTGPAVPETFKGVS